LWQLGGIEPNLILSSINIPSGEERGVVLAQLETRRRLRRIIEKRSSWLRMLLGMAMRPSHLIDHLKRIIKTSGLVFL
jgi:hypothetical protein